MPNAMFFYRISRWFYKFNVPVVPKFFQLIIFIIYNSRVPCSADIGKGSFLVVKGIGVSIHDGAKIGKNCSIGIGCKIVGKSPYKKVPVLGNGVFIGPGAVIVGPVIIGNNVIVAPNSVVTKSVGDGYIIAGVPAKIIGHIDELPYNILDNVSKDESIADYLVDKRVKIND